MTFPDSFFRWRPHPWHGLDVGPDPPGLVHAYVEITPFDLVKYELDKKTGYLRVDRPQRTSSQPPTLYGFIPQTFCGPRVGALSPKAKRGDGDPLDICVLSERPINRSEVILNVHVVGGLQMIDGGEADDKIIAVLENDYVWGKVEVLVERLRHYFTTYKMVQGSGSEVLINRVYGRDHALEVIQASMDDYMEEYSS
jgi:inorganic pyrophosphatase